MKSGNVGENEETAATRSEAKRIDEELTRVQERNKNGKFYRMTRKGAEEISTLFSHDPVNLSNLTRQYHNLLQSRRRIREKSGSNPSTRLLYRLTGVLLCGNDMR